MSNSLCNLFRHGQSLETKDLPRRQSFLMEPLESRLLLSVTLIDVPNWVEQGPASITGNTNVTNIGQNNAVGGAVEAIAAVDANTLYIATTNGGIWRGTNVSFS